MDLWWSSQSHDALLQPSRHPGWRNPQPLASTIYCPFLAAVVASFSFHDVSVFASHGLLFRPGASPGTCFTRVPTHTAHVQVFLSFFACVRPAGFVSSLQCVLSPSPPHHLPRAKNTHYYQATRTYPTRPPKKPLALPFF